MPIKRIEWTRTVAWIRWGRNPGMALLLKPWITCHELNF